MNDTELLERFLAGTLDSFPHRDHVRVAFVLLGSNGFDEATRVLSERIRAMAAAGGDPTKFHVTRSEAWMHLIGSARARDSTASGSEEFLQRHPELLRSGLLDDYYSADLLRSDAARSGFVEPDLAPLALAAVGALEDGAEPA